jgi:NTE family protein
MHVVRLLAPSLHDEDHTKDIDFSPAGVRARRRAGYLDTLTVIDTAPWKNPVDPIEGVVVHVPEGARAAIHEPPPMQSGA